MKRKFGFFDIFRKNDAEIQFKFAMQNLQKGAKEEAFGYFYCPPIRDFHLHSSNWQIVMRMDMA